VKKAQNNNIISIE